jgi:hypothetical protein
LVSLHPENQYKRVSQDLDKQAVIMSNPSVLCVVRSIRKTAAGHDFRPRVCRDGEG